MQAVTMTLTVTGDGSKREVCLVGHACRPRTSILRFPFPYKPTEAEEHTPSEADQVGTTKVPR